MLLTESVNDLYEFGPQPHPGTGGTDLFVGLVHEPAHDLVGNFHVWLMKAGAPSAWPPVTRRDSGRARLPAMGAYGEGEVIDHAHHNHQVKVRLPG
ncbi:hypothetical protein ABZ468_29230 [Streptomyces sp. NPDC005708]|uniref:hypothetical protein n=1 Tax=unclassified Streptomyces TaxID=2593676 RepID=UPI0033F9E64C